MPNTALAHANLPAVRFEGERDGRAQVRFGDTLLRERMPHGRPNGHGAGLCLRPHAVSLSDGGENVLRGRVRDVLWQGDQHSIALDAQGQELGVVSAHLDDAPAVPPLTAEAFAA